MLNQEIGRRIADIRRARQLTQEQLGEKLGVSAQAVSKWEKGESLPDVCMLPGISRELGLSTDTLLSIPAADTRNRLLERLSKSMDRWDLGFVWDAWTALWRAGTASTQHGAPMPEDGVNSIVTDGEAAILDGKGLGAIFTEDYTSMLRETDIDEFSKLLSLLGEKENIRILLSLRPGKRLSYDRLRETTLIPEGELKERMMRLLTHRVVNLDEEGYCLESERWPCLLLVVSGVNLWISMKNRPTSYYHSVGEAD